jgi:hypothetical protein
MKSQKTIMKERLFIVEVMHVTIGILIWVVLYFLYYKF